MYKLSQYVVEQDIYDENSGNCVTLLFSTRSSSFLSFNRSFWEEMKLKSFSDLQIDIQLLLIEHKIIVEKEIDELDEVLSENINSINASDSLYFPIQPTASCPFGCNYCGQSHSSKSMTHEIQNALIDRIAKKIKLKEYRSLSIAWFGAEPLSGLKVIEELSPRIQDLALQNSLEYSAKIVTNGFLLNEEIIKNLVYKHKIKIFEITLDGIKEFHDVRRFLKTGGPSFDKIYENIKILTSLEKPPSVIIRCNVDTTNFEGISPLIEKIAIDELSTKVFMYIAPIHSWGNEAHKISAEKKLFAQWEIDWLIEMRKAGIQFSYLPRRKKSVCFAVNPESELIDPFGGIYGCSEVSLVPFYEKDGKNVHELARVTDKNILKKENIFGNFYSREELDKYDCSKCPMLPTCGGGCPKEWKEGRVPCPSTKFNIKERMILQYIETNNQEKMKYTYTKNLEDKISC